MKCTAVIIHENLFHQVSASITHSDSVLSYIVTKHEDECIDLDCFGTHYHVVIWSINNISDMVLGRRLRKLGQKGSEYTFEPARSDRSVLLYVTQFPRVIVDKKLSPEHEDMLTSFTPQDRKYMQMHINTRYSGTPISQETETPKKKKVYPQDAFKLMLKYKSKDYDEMLSMLMANDPDEYWIYAAPHNKKHLETTSNDAVKVYYKPWSWLKQAKDRADLFTSERGYYSVEDTRWWMRIIADVNGMHLADLQRLVIPWLLGELPKKNCLYIYGESNSCKTKFANSLADGVYNLGMFLTSNEFYFQECKNTSMILWEETKITDEKQLPSDAKKIFEGQPIKCNKKHHDGFWLSRTPVLCTSNYTPWDFVKHERVTFENRMTYLTFYADERLRPLTRSLNPLFWVEVLEHGRDWVPEEPKADIIQQAMEWANEEVYTKRIHNEFVPLVCAEDIGFIKDKNSKIQKNDEPLIILDPRE